MEKHKRDELSGLNLIPINKDQLANYQTFEMNNFYLDLKINASKVYYYSNIQGKKIYNLLIVLTNSCLNLLFILKQDRE